MGLLSPLASRSIAACSAVFATQLSRAAGLPSAAAGTKPVLTAKYPAPASTASVKMTPRKKLAIDLIYMLSLLKQVLVRRSIRSSRPRNLAGHGQRITRSPCRYRERPTLFLLAIRHLLDPGAIRYDGIFWDHDYSVAHVKLFRVQVGSFTIRGDHHPLADPGVFVDDRSIDH